MWVWSRQTNAQHILQDCILYSDQRSAIWPTEVSLKKNYGSCSDAADHRVHQDYISDHLELTGERKEEEEEVMSDRAVIVTMKTPN